MTDKPKGIGKFEAAYANAMKLNPGHAGLILSECTKRLKRIATQAEPELSEYEEMKVTQTNGPTLIYQAIKLAGFNSEGEGRERWTIGSIDETPAGAYVAVLERCSDIVGEIDLVSAVVIEPDSDEVMRRHKVMDHFGWSDGARGMAKKLDWSIIQEID